LESLLDAVRGSAASWHEGKLFIEHLGAICHDTLHLIAGVAIWLVIAAISRRSIRSWLPLLGTAIIATLNEAVDLWVELWPSPGHQLGEGARDILATIAIPALLTAAIRLRPSLFDGRTRRAHSK
jgi:hypothetical protein